MLRGQMLRGNPIWRVLAKSCSGSLEGNAATLERGRQRF
jgi:hypothetical protein